MTDEELLETLKQVNILLDKRNSNPELSPAEQLKIMIEVNQLLDKTLPDNKTTGEENNNEG